MNLDLPQDQPEQMSDILSEDIDQLERQYQQRRDQRQKKLSTVRLHMEKEMKVRERKEQNIVLYFINLFIPLFLTLLNAYILLDLGVNSELKGKLIIPFVGGGFLVAVFSNLQIAPWLQVLKLYFIIDSLIPLLIAGIIGFFSVFNFLTTGEWYQHGFAVCFPTWVIYYAGSLRVMITYLKWSRWKIILYKLVVMLCGLIFFYVGFTYMNGAYKITKGYLPGVQGTIKNTVYLYVFGICDLFFEYYRKLSAFDQTEDLKYFYQFKDCSQNEDNSILELELKRFESDVLREQFDDRIVTMLKSNKQIPPRDESSLHQLR